MNTTLQKIYAKIFDNGTKKINAKSVRESFALMDDKIEKAESGIKGFLKIGYPKPAPDVVGKYELVDIGEYTNLVPIIPYGGTEPQTTPITTHEGFYNSVYWDGVNFTESKVENSTKVIDDLTSNSTNYAGSANNDRILKNLIDKLDNDIESDSEILKDMLVSPPTSMGTFETKYLQIKEKFIIGQKYRISIKVLSILNNNPETAFTVHLEPEQGGSPYQVLFTDQWISLGDTYTLDFTALYNSERVMFTCSNFGCEIETSIDKVQNNRTGIIPDIENLKKPLAEKKIVWFGTSIPAGIDDIINVDGYSGANKYPSVVSFLTGATVYNEAIGGTRISTGWASEYNGASNPLGLRNQQDNAFQIYSSLGHTIAEKDYIYDNWAAIRHYFSDNSGLSNTPPKTREEFRDYSFERKLIKKYLTDSASISRADLYVIDHSFNDYSKVLESIAMPDFYSDIERMQYWGAVNYFIRKIYADNPHHRIVMISHYRNNGEDQYIKLYEAQKAISKFWGIPFIDISEKMQVGQQFITSNGYWDELGIWHSEGYTYSDNGTSYTTNDKGIPDFWKDYNTYKSIMNPRQVVSNSELATIYKVGTWVRDIHPQLALMKDNLHPYSDMSGNMTMRIAKIISQEILKYL